MDFYYVLKGQTDQKSQITNTQQDTLAKKLKKFLKSVLYSKSFEYKQDSKTKASQIEIELFYIKKNYEICIVNLEQNYSAINS